MHKILLQYLALIGIALLLGLYIPGLGNMLYPYNKVWIFCLILLSALKISTKDIINLGREKLFIVIVALIRLILVPVVVFVISNAFVPEYQIPLTLLALAPVGSTSALFTEMLGGKPSLTLALVTITGILTPFWIPSFFHIFMQQDIHLPVGSMIIDLAMVLILPVVLSEFLQVFFKPVVKKTEKYHRYLSMVLLLFILTGVLTSQIDKLILINPLVLLWTSLLMLILFLGLGLFGWGAAIYREKEEEIAVVTSFVLMNFSLSIYIGSKFFAHMPLVVLAVVLSVIPWNLSYVILGELFSWLHGPVASRNR